jgi:predicted TIM-barrel fold metal-dependent hydrolase
MIVDRIAVVDADSHLTEPADLWVERVPSKYADIVPRVVVSPAGREVWLIGDKMVQGAAATSAAGLDEYWPDYPKTLSEVDPAAYDPVARAAKMDEFGLRAQVLYPNLLAFNLFDFFAVGDEAFRLACVKAYNDYQTEFSAAAPGRFVPISVLPFWDLEAAVAEIERCHQAGHGGLLFPNAPEMIKLPPLRDRHWDPLYAAAQERHLSLNFHIGFGGFDNTLGVSAFPSRSRRRTAQGQEELAMFRADLAKVSTLGLISNSRAIVEVLISGICDRFPSLNFVSVESGFGYVPYLVQALDWQWLNNGAAAAHPGRLMPSEYFKRQVYTTFWFEGPTVTRFVEDYVDNIMFESDFPHPTSLAPGPVSHTDSPDKVIEANLSGLSDDVLTRILSTNAAHLYNIQPSLQTTPA